jgi:GT2 family glycosyltransferase
VWDSSVARNVLEPLFAVVVNWNSREDTKACVASLFMAGVSQGRVIIVDNGSSDNSAKSFLLEFGRAIELIQNTQNRGFAAAVNQGIERALQKGAAWVFLVNNDTLVAPDIVQELDRTANAATSYHILSPLILFDDETNRIWSAGDRQIPGTFITVGIQAGQINRDKLPSLMPVDFVTGCGMLIARSVFERIGLFDPAFFMYAEDADYCWRARRAGIQIACATRARMWHKVSVSASRNIATRLYLQTRNQVHFYRRYARGLQVPLMLVFTIARVLALMLLHMRRHELQWIRPLVHGWRDGWLEPQPIFQYE